MLPSATPTQCRKLSKNEISLLVIKSNIDNWGDILLVIYAFWTI